MYRLPTSRRYLSLLLLILSGVAPSTLFSQTPDTARLAEPDVADRLQLSDQQRAQIQLHLQERTKTATIENVEERRAQVATIDQTILGLLTDEQRTLFAKPASNGKLRFQFREIAWDRVLEWFAKQEDLTLIMDRVPAGTFTYSDQREYTSAEAIDLLNSVLMTRGHSLVRREKMLVVVELNDTIPVELIPKITLEELPARGRFELVSVLFKIGSRPVDDVLKEIRPYLSTYGRALPLPQSKQLLVIENAGKMETINVLIASVPEPRPPAPKPDPPPPPTPVFASYSIGGLDAESTLATIRKLIGSEQITVDSKTQVLSAFVIPAQQQAIQSAIGKMVAEHSQLPAESPLGYALDGKDADSVLKQIASLVPKAKATLDKTVDQIVVVATAMDHEKVHGILRALGIQASQERIAKTFPLDRKPSDAWTASLQGLVPKAKVWTSSDGKHLSIFGTPKEVKLLESLLPQLIEQIPATPVRKLKLYSVSQEQKDRLQGLLTPLTTELPTMKIVDSTRPGELLVWASTIEHELLDTLLQELASSPSPSESVLRRYDIPKTSLSQLTLLETEIEKRYPPLQLQIDPTNAWVWAWGPETTHAQFVKALEPLQAPMPVDRQPVFVTYTLKHGDAVAIKALLAEVHKEISVVADSKRKLLLATGTLEQHAKLKAAIEQLDQPTSKLSEQELRTYDLGPLLSASLVASLQTMWPETKLVADTATNRLLATGTIEDHQQIELAIARLRDTPPGMELKVKSYAIPYGDIATVSNVLSQLAPKSVGSADVINRTFTILATEEQHQRVAQAIEQLSQTSSTRQELSTYIVPPGRVTNIRLALTTLFPTANIAVDSTTGQIIALATKEQQERIAQVIEKSKLEPQDAQGMRLPKRYDVPSTFRSALPNLIANAAPSATVITPVTDLTSPIVVLGSSDEHARIEQVVEELRAELEQLSPQTAQAEVKLFVIDSSVVDSTSVMLSLKAALPSEVVLQANGSTNAVIVSGTKQQVARAEELILSMQSQKDSQARSLKVYSMRYADPTAAARVLTSLIPRAAIAADLATRSIAVTATPAEHQRVSEFATAFDMPRQDAQETKAYRIRKGNPITLASSLQLSIPQATFAGDATNLLLIATANAEQHQKIETLLEQLNKNEGVKLSTRGYLLKSSDATAVSRALAASFPQAVISPDAINGEISVTADEHEHDLIAKFVDQTNLSPGRKPTLRTLHVTQASATLVATAVQKALARSTTAGVSADEASGSVFIVGTPEDLAIAEQLVQQIDSEQDPRGNRTLKVFSVDGRDGRSLRDSIEALFLDHRPKVDIEYDSLNDRMVVIGTQEQIAMVEESMKQFVGPEKTLEIFPVRSNDASSVRAAIQSAFSDTPTSEAPSITVDESKQQLIVRATASQLMQIRELLLKLGETNVGANHAPPASRLRILPISDSEKSLQYIRRVWPIVRKNPLEILDPNAPPSEPVADPNSEPPVLIIPGEGQWTIASADTAALEELSQLLSHGQKQSMEPIVTTGNYSMFLLKHAGASDVEKILRDLVQSASTSSTAGSLGRVRIVADDRTNGLLVYGGIADRTTIAQLLAVIDDDGNQDSLRSILPKLVPVENTDAKRIVQVVRDVYKSQLSADAGRRPIPIPAGVTANVATLIQQMNATAAAPLLTLGVDPTSNSIVMRAPTELALEVEKFIELLDKQALDHSTTRIDIVPLKSTNVTRLRKALDTILDPK